SVISVTSTPRMAHAFASVAITRSAPPPPIDGTISTSFMASRPSWPETESAGIAIMTAVRMTASCGSGGPGCQPGNFSCCHPSLWCDGFASVQPGMQVPAGEFFEQVDIRREIRAQFVQQCRCDGLLLDRREVGLAQGFQHAKPFDARALLDVHRGAQERFGRLLRELRERLRTCARAPVHAWKLVASVVGNTEERQHLAVNARRVRGEVVVE